MPRNRTLLLTALLAGVLAWLLGPERSLAQALPAPPSGMQTLFSSSRQFIVSGRTDLSPTATFLQKDPEDPILFVDPSYLLIACEKIKGTLLRELGVSDQWRHKIHLTIHPARSESEKLILVSEKFIDGWRYRVEVPSEIPAHRLVDGLVQVILQEMANRRAGDKAAELPVWVAIGISEHLKTSGLRDFFSGSAGLPVADGLRISSKIQEYWRRDPFWNWAELFSQNGPLPFQDLTWASRDFFESARAAYLRKGAHLLVRELLKLPQGGPRIAAMIGEFPAHLNWQTAFLASFQPIFPTLLDAEKWWSLITLRLGSSRLLTRSGSIDAVQAWLRTRVSVRLSTNDSPMRAEVPIQVCLAQWDWKTQQQFLSQKISELVSLEPRLSPEVRPVVEGYRAVIGRYIQERQARLSPQKLREIVAQVTRELDWLDSRFQSFQESADPEGALKRRLAPAVQNESVPAP